LNGGAQGRTTGGSDEIPAPRILELLRHGTMTLIGLLRWSSNYTFLGEVALDGDQAPVVYKPTRGERPLWDFPRGTLAMREAAAFVVSDALGWALVPPTVLRDGPHGQGSVQLFLEVDQEAHFFTFREEPGFRHALQSLALFDILANNADRKGGHCLRAAPGKIIAIDHGLCFHVEPKLRTVIWDFAGERIPDDLAADLARVEGELQHPQGSSLADLAGLLQPAEVRAIRRRVARLLSSGAFPDPPEDRRPYPWPPV
jgi:uncharacterized repeat protein (TIGR03843 family)